MTDFGRVAVLMGGWSAEREVSLSSGKAVLAALKSQGIEAFAVDVKRQELSNALVGKCDRVFNILHGTWGEDGRVQGLLDTLDIPYTGTGVRGCALTMDTPTLEPSLAGLTTTGKPCCSPILLAAVTHDSRSLTVCHSGVLIPLCKQTTLVNALSIVSAQPRTPVPV